MKELNELVELAKKATKGAWVADSGEGWDAIISQQDMVNSNFIIGEFIGPDSKANKDFVLAASPESILVIAEAFRALEKRAEAAEAALERESDIHIDTAASMREWRLRAEAAEAKLAGRGSLKALGWQFEQCEGESCDKGAVVNVSGADVHLCADCSRDKKYSRMKVSALPKRLTYPAPAADLAALVPGEMFMSDAVNANLSTEWMDGFNACRVEILRNIEEAK